jgi:hypothetical protein
VSSPPTTGPAARAMADTPDHSPMAWTRSRGSGKAAVSRASEPGSSAAAPTACRARAVTRAGRLGASPHRAEAAVNTTRPVRNTRRRPNRSPSDPAVSSRLAKTRM